MTKLSKKDYQMMMGMWFLASAYGQYVAGPLGAGMSSPDEKPPLVTKLTRIYRRISISTYATAGFTTNCSFSVN
jgi:dipeptide/tripeptide permease